MKGESQWISVPALLPWRDNSEGCFSEGPQGGLSTAAYRGHQLVEAAFIVIPSSLTLLSLLVFHETIFPISPLTQGCLSLLSETARGREAHTVVTPEKLSRI